MPLQQRRARVDGREVLYEWEQRCHRAEPDTARRVQVGEAPAASKKDACCPFFRRWRVYADAPDVAEITEHCGHVGHEPGSPEDRAWRPLDAAVARELEVFLRARFTPVRALVALQAAATARGETSPSSRALTTTLAQVQNFASTVAADSRFSANDVAAVEKMVKVLGEGDEGSVLYYQRQKLRPGGAVEERLELAVMPEFGVKMLQQFGGKIPVPGVRRATRQAVIYLDTTWGMDKYGYGMKTALVRDEYGQGCPVAACISEGETAESWGRFLEAVLKKAGLAAADCVFMIDKSLAEIAAIKALGARYLLCKFHFLQEGDRWLKTVESGVAGVARADDRFRIVHRLIKLQRVADARAFAAESEAFKRWLVDSGMEAVANWYSSNWELDAPFWAGERNSGLRLSPCILSWNF